MLLRGHGQQTDLITGSPEPGQGSHARPHTSPRPRMTAMQGHLHPEIDLLARGNQETDFYKNWRLLFQTSCSGSILEAAWTQGPARPEVCLRCGHAWGHPAPGAGHRNGVTEAAPTGGAARTAGLLRPCERHQVPHWPLSTPRAALGHWPAKGTPCLQVRGLNSCLGVALPSAGRGASDGLQGSVPPSRLSPPPPSPP